MDYLQITFAIVLLFGVCHSRYLDLQNDAKSPTPRLDFISEKILKMLEIMREKMKDGIPEAGIPPLDPLLLPAVKLGPLTVGHLGEIKVANFENIKVDGLPKFEVTGIKANVLMMKATVNITLAKLDIDGSYELDGIFLGFLPIFGNGAVKAVVDGTNVSATAQLAAKDSVFFLESLELDASIGNVGIHLENLVGGGDLGEQLNAMVEKVGNRLVQNLAPKIISGLTEFARLKANEIIKDMEIV